MHPRGGAPGAVSYTHLDVYKRQEERGYVGPFEGSKPRQLLIDKAKWQELKMAKAPAPEPEYVYKRQNRNHILNPKLFFPVI